jgi:hypothetical protein
MTIARSSCLSTPVQEEGAAAKEHQIDRTWLCEMVAFC